MTNKTANVFNRITSALEVQVRETGYNAAMIAASGNKGEAYSRAICLYEHACDTLLAWAKYRGTLQDAERFIAATWKPTDGELATLRTEYPSGVESMNDVKVIYEPTLEVLFSCRTVKDAEKWIAVREAADPIGVARGDYGIDAPEEKVNPCTDPTGA